MSSKHEARNQRLKEVVDKRSQRRSIEKREISASKQDQIQYTLRILNPMLEKLDLEPIQASGFEMNPEGLHNEVMSRQTQIKGKMPLFLDRRTLRIASAFLILLLMAIPTSSVVAQSRSNDLFFETGENSPFSGDEQSVEYEDVTKFYQQKIEQSYASFEDLVENQELSSERIFMPEQSGLSQGEMVLLMDYHSISVLGMRAGLARETLEAFNLSFYLEEDDRQMLAHGDWVDTYLDIVRMGSHGTTLLITDEEGNFLRFLPAMHSDLMNQGEFAVITQTYTEELVQQAIYTHFVMMWQENRELFKEYGIESLEDLIESLSSGNLRAFLEYVQHAMIKESSNGWTFFPYTIQVDNRPLSRSITNLNNQTTELVQSLPQENGEALTYLDVLRAYSNPVTFFELNQSFYEQNGYPIWDSYGMFREGMRVVPSSIDVNLDVHFVQAETSGPAKTVEQEWSEQIGNIVYVRAIAPHEVFYLRKQEGQDPERIVPSTDRVVQEGRILRVEIIDSQIAQVLPDEGMYMPFGDGYQDIFVNLDKYVQVPDFEPITVFLDTQNQDKQIIVLQNDHPEILLFEGSRLILRAPVVLGAQGSTPNGRHFVSRTRGSRHMPGQPGVGFVGYFGGGNALHDSPWWDWSTVDTGFYGSHGCVNLPDYSWSLIPYGDREISVSQFVYSWISSVLPTKAGEESAQVTWDTPGFYEGEIAVRMLIIPNSDRLYSFAQQGSADMSDLAEAVETNTGIILPTFRSQR